MSLCVKLLDGLEVTRESTEGRLLSFTKEVGFEAISWLGCIETIPGHIGLHISPGTQELK